VIGDSKKQADWRTTQKAHMLEQDESATDLFYRPGAPKQSAQKFELVDSQTQQPHLVLHGRVEQIEHIDQTEINTPYGALTNTPDGWLAAGQRIAGLPLNKQTQIILSGLSAGAEQCQLDERERQWGAIIGSVEGVGNVAINLAKIADFSAYCAIGDKARAAQMGEEFGTALGQTVASGVRLFEATQKYSYDVGYSGDYAKPARDLMATGKILNDEWSQLPPREQERRKYEILSQMVADGLVGTAGAQAIGKAKTLTEVLDTVAEQVAKSSAHGIEHTEKTAGKIANIINDLLAPELAIAGGGKTKLPKLESGEENMLRMTGKFGDYVPEHEPLYMKPASNKLLKERDIEVFGGLHKLEQMNDGELALVGLRRFKLPNLRLSRDDYSLQVRVAGDKRAWFRANAPCNGTVEVTDIYSGDLPEGAGNHLLTAALIAHKALPSEKLVFKQILEPRTIDQLKAGVAPSDTVMGKLGIKTLKQLGYTPTNCTVEMVRGHLNMTITTR
jgi:hypothetical protein